MCIVSALAAGGGTLVANNIADKSTEKKHKEKLAKINQSIKDQEDLNKRSEGYQVNLKQQTVPTKTQNTITTSPVTTGLNLGV